MPLQIPNLDDRNFEQLLEEARRRIPVYTPEWTNFDLDSDPGITIVQLFASLTDTLLYRANRIPERDRLKFLSLLGIPLRPAGAAVGIVTVTNQRGPVAALPLGPGVIVRAGNVGFLTQDGVTVLPVEARAYYKSPVSDPARVSDYQTKYAAVLAAAQTLDTGADAGTDGTTTLTFYETSPLAAPTAGAPNPSLDLIADTADRCLYLALLAPPNVDPDAVRAAIASKVLSIGVVPASTGNAAPLIPARRDPNQAAPPGLVYEIADASGSQPVDRYARLKMIQQPDVLNAMGVAEAQLPNVNGLQTWDFNEPMQEGTGDFPPRLEDDAVTARLVTWLRLRLPAMPGDTGGAAGTSGGGAAFGAVTQNAQGGAVSAKISWAGVNAARVMQAILVPNEVLGTGTGEPDQTAATANRPVIDGAIQVGVEDDNGVLQLWRLTDDLLAAGPDDPVFTLDAEAGQIQFGDGLRGARPQYGQRIRASYQYGGGAQGNVAIGAINATPDLRLQGGFALFNPLPAFGGDDGDSEADGERNIPLYLRHRDRAVTALDFADIIRNTPGVTVGRVETLPLFQPDQPLLLAPGVVTALVLPVYDAVNPLWPAPDRLFLSAVCAYLDLRRLITTEVYARGPIYVNVYVTVGVQVQDGFFRDVVLQAVTQRLNVYLSSLPPGGPDGAGWPLNKPVLEKDLEAVVTRVSGVEYVNALNFSVQDNLTTLSGLQLPILAGLSVTAGDADPLSAVMGGAGGSGGAGRSVPVPVTKSRC